MILVPHQKKERISIRNRYFMRYFRTGLEKGKSIYLREMIQRFIQSAKCRIFRRKCGRDHFVWFDQLYLLREKCNQETF